MFVIGVITVDHIAIPDNDVQVDAAGAGFDRPLDSAQALLHLLQVLIEILIIKRG